MGFQRVYVRGSRSMIDGRRPMIGTTAHHFGMGRIGAIEVRGMIGDSWNSSFREEGEDLAAGFGFGGLLGGALGGGAFVVALFLPERE